MYKTLLTLLLIFLGCGSDPWTDASKPSRPGYSVDRLVSKVELYTELLQPKRDKHGFILTDKCDATLFSGLLGAALPGTVDILAAKNGKYWFRRPGQDCGPDFQNSRSTISRDMMLGVMWHFWKNKQLDEAVELMRVLKGNAFMLPGQGTVGELGFNASMLNTLALIIQNLNGPEFAFELILPAYFSEGEGYVSHLTAWHILLRGDIKGKISNREMNILYRLMKREPQNPLYAAGFYKYLDKGMQPVVKLLLESPHWPSDRLPTTTEHCAEWPIQRDKGKDWNPCPKKDEEHTGAELLLIYHLLLKEDADDANGPQRAG